MKIVDDLPTTSTAGQLEEKQHALNEKDSMWVELRHKHFADAIHDISQQARRCLPGSGLG